MQEIAEGFILTNDGDIAKVRVAPNASCDNCNTCSIPHMEILAYNPLKALPGQKVRFTMAENSMLKIAFIIFLLPLFSIFAGIYTGMVLAVKAGFNEAAFMTVSGIMFFAVSVVFIYFYDKKYKLNKNNFPQIIEVIPE